jgi:hypothetical protein
MKVEDKVIADFLATLGQTLPVTYLAIREPGPLLFCPAGLWLFQVESWNGTIVRQDGVWKQIQSVRDKLGRKQSQVQTREPAPDDEWLRRKGEIEKILSERLPQRAWVGSLIQGGVAFTHPKASLDKPHIQGNTAAYRTARGWTERIRVAPAVGDFTLEIQLEMLEALYEHPGEQAASAKDEAERLYQEAEGELRQSIVKMVN